MSVATAIAAIAHPKGQHRAADEVDRLRYRLDKSSAANAELRRRLAEATGGRDAANAKANRLGDAELRAAEATQRADTLAAEVTALRAALANATAKSAPTGQRDIDPDDQPTSPTGINVRPLWDALGIVPGSTDPAHVPGL